MKPKFILIACALLLMTNIAVSQEQKDRGAGAQEQQQAPTAKMTGEDVKGHMCQRKMGPHGMRGMMGHGMHMRLIFILMDTDGDGTLSLEEFQTAHAKIFKGIDADKDGKVTPVEMQMFFSGGSQVPDRGSEPQ
jgi:EF hand